MLSYMKAIVIMMVLKIDVLNKQAPTKKKI